MAAWYCSAGGGASQTRGCREEENCGELGRNWSAAVTVKAGHELVTTGPYAIVRHPIYAGLLLAFIGTAVARGDLGAVAAVVLVGWAFRRKTRLEERWMREQFGAAYEAYARRVPALFPWWS